MATAPPPSTKDDTHPEELRRVLTYRLARVQAKLNAQGVRILNQNSDLTLVQWRILTLLGRTGQSTSTNLARMADFDKGLLSRKLKTMVSDGLVLSKPHETDKRVQILSLTEKGQALHDATLPNMSQRQAVLTQEFSPQELDVFFDCLDKLERAAASKQS